MRSISGLEVPRRGLCEQTLARELCGRLYWKVFDASETHLDALAGQDNERYLPLSREVESRFGGRPA